MDLFLLSYLVQQGRYHVPAERVAEAMLSLIRPEPFFPSADEPEAGADRARAPVADAPSLPR
ncbi:MAG TPA: hypothetical protein VHK89_02025 [Actinomycetota bacterium]|nr:hypothetical protein [Actinomycetota bacterium]